VNELFEGITKPYRQPDCETTVKDRIIWAIVGEFDISFPLAKDLIMKEFGVSI
jgi:hypothetical protein